MEGNDPLGVLWCFVLFSLWKRGKEKNGSHILKKGHKSKLEQVQFRLILLLVLSVEDSAQKTCQKEFLLLFWQSVGQECCHGAFFMSENQSCLQTPVCSISLSVSWKISVSVLKIYTVTDHVKSKKAGNLEMFSCCYTRSFTKESVTILHFSSWLTFTVLQVFSKSLSSMGSIS